jgi:hypothetical protein
VDLPLEFRQFIQVWRTVHINHNEIEGVVSSRQATTSVSFAKALTDGPLQKAIKKRMPRWMDQRIAASASGTYFTRSTGPFVDK